jgi:hypothetical protein
MKTYMIALSVLLTLSACGAAGAVGDECTADEDCAEGLECHFHDDHDDHEEDSEEEEHEDEEHGECEAHEDE